MKNKAANRKNQVAKPAAGVVESTKQASAAAPATETEAPSADAGEQVMTEQNQATNGSGDPAAVPQVTFTRSDTKRRSNMLVFLAPEGRRGSLRISKSLFTKDKVPTTLTVENPAFAEAKKARESMTKEERKAARAAQPKLTPAQKVAKLEERLAKERKRYEEQVAKAGTPTDAAAASM